jgi:hypothetical protein
MDQIRDLADHRLIAGCIYCGGRSETRDHVPSRVFLDPPFPENLPVVPACEKCNLGFALDEQYVACAIEAASIGTTDPSQLERARIADLMRRQPALRSMIERCKSTRDGARYFEVEAARVRNVLLKLARGHAAFELSTLCRAEPSRIWWSAVSEIAAAEWEEFDTVHVIETFGEVGSRGLQRAMIVQAIVATPNEDRSSLTLLVNDWVEVQEGRYRYLAVHDSNEVRIKILIRGYLACEVAWTTSLRE